MINDDLSKKKSPHFREKCFVLSYLKCGVKEESNLSLSTHASLSLSLTHTRTRTHAHVHAHARTHRIQRLKGSIFFAFVMPRWRSRGRAVTIRCFPIVTPKTSSSSDRRMTSRCCSTTAWWASTYSDGAIRNALISRSFLTVLCDHWRLFTNVSV